jgi:peroxiredoxin
MIRFVVLTLVLCTALIESGSAAAGADELYAAAGMKKVIDHRPAPTFALKTVEGRPIDSQSLRGKVVLLNFWATWCGPCKDEMPALQRLKQTFGRENFELLAVTTDQQPENIRKFVGALNLDFPILMDDSKDVSAAFGVRGLPTTIVISKNGLLLGQAVGPREWDAPESVALIHALVESSP